MGSSGPSTTTQQTTTSQPPWASYWGKQLLNAAGPYYLGNQTMPGTLNQGTAPFTSDQLNAFGGIENLSGLAENAGVAGSNYLTNLLSGNGPNVTAPTVGAPGIGATAPTMTPEETNLLNETMGGAFLNPSSNPYLTATFNEAAKGVTDQYNTSTAPSLMAEGEMASGGGPGSLAGSSGFNEAQWQNRYGLGQNLNNLATNIYGGAYNQERQNQMAAAGLSQQGTEAAAANQLQAGIANAQNQLQASEANQQGQLQAEEFNAGLPLQGLGLLPQTISSLYQPANELLGVGSLQQQQEQTTMDTTFQNALRAALWPQGQFTGLASLLGPAAGNASNQVTVGPNPYATK